MSWRTIEGEDQGVTVTQPYSKVDVQRARLVVKLNDSLKRPTSPDVRQIAAAGAGQGNGSQGR